MSIKAKLSGLPAWVKVLFYFTVMALAMFTGSIYHKVDDLTFYLAVSFILSWFLLKIDGLGLMSLGLLPTKKADWANLGWGLLMGLIMLITVCTLAIVISHVAWHFTDRLNPIYILMSSLFTLLSVVVQEFVFRGYPFQTLLKSYKPWVAQLIVVVPFGLMHIHLNMDATQIASIMFTTGLGSVLFGLAYIKTKKLMMPIGIHFGWNFAQSLIFNKDMHGASVLFIDSKIESFSHIFTMCYTVIIIIAILILLRWKGNYTR